MRHTVEKRLRRIPTIEAQAQCSIVVLAQRAADRGESLKALARQLSLAHGTLKAALSRRGYHHPIGADLLDRRLQATSGIGLEETLRRMVKAGLSRGRIAKDLRVDPATLQTVADRLEIYFPKTIVFRDTSKIVAAMKARIPLRSDLRRIEYDGRVQCLADWARESGIAVSTLHSRLARGLTVADALSTTVRTCRRRKSMSKTRTRKLRDPLTGQFIVRIPGKGTKSALLLRLLRQGPATSVEISRDAGLGLRGASALLHELWRRGLIERDRKRFHREGRGIAAFMYGSIGSFRSPAPRPPMRVHRKRVGRYERRERNAEAQGGSEANS